MSEIKPGMRVRSLRATVPGVGKPGGYLGRLGTIVEVGPGGDRYVDVQWDNDPTGSWYWFLKDVEIVEGESDV